SKAARAESLKSSLAGSTTAKYKLGLRNCSKELLSRITDSESPYAAVRACSKAARSKGSPSARKPCLVLSQNEQRARAARKQALSVPVSECISQSRAQICSFGAQSQSSPFCAQTPWPYCVIFPAIQFALGNAVITSHTSCVLPMLRVWPPTTMTRQRVEALLSFSVKLGLNSFDAPSERRKLGKPRVRFLEFANPPRGRAPDCLPVTDRFACGDSGLRASNGPILERAMVGDSTLPADDYVPTD